MILGMIHLTSHDEKTLEAIEIQVLDDNKSTIITKEGNGFVYYQSVGFNETSSKYYKYRVLQKRSGDCFSLKD